MELHDPMTTIARTARPTGEPARCADCGAICSPSRYGPPLCGDHILEQANRAQGRTVHPPGSPSRQSTWAKKRRADARRKQRPESAPPPTPTDRPRTLQERLKARREAAERKDEA